MRLTAFRYTEESTDTMVTAGMVMDITAMENMDTEKKEARILKIKRSKRVCFSSRTE